MEIPEASQVSSTGFRSGNGAMNIEMTCDPFSEQILFHHESLLMPWKGPLSIEPDNIPKWKAMPEKMPVKIHIKLGRHEPLEWADQIS